MPIWIASRTPRKGKSRRPTARTFAGAVTLTAPVSGSTSPSSIVSALTALSVGTTSRSLRSHHRTCTMSICCSSIRASDRSTAAVTSCGENSPEKMLGTSLVKIWTLLGPRSISYLRLKVASILSTPAYMSSELASPKRRCRGQCGKDGPLTSKVVSPASASAKRVFIHGTSESGSAPYEPLTSVSCASASASLSWSSATRLPSSSFCSASLSGVFSNFFSATARSFLS
mmetsp:Transcript_16047/g.38047  ORF Transcript_16047/g.38047 Transcript_16047/m.38047 type:complete len:229 (-) Transcript_16047:448-1134(-)